MSKQSNDSLFGMQDFRSYIKTWVRAKGRGESRRISQVLNVHTTLVSQVINGHKCLTEEQASQLCSYMCLTTLETDYFLKLVQIERAGTALLRELYKRQLKQISNQADEIGSRVPEAKTIGEQDRALFYSSWQYSLIRLLTGIDKQSVESLSARLGLPVSRVQEILDFLASRGLCTEERGWYKRTEKNTHIEASSSLSVRHHQNWRGKSLELLERMTAKDLAFTAPISIAKKDISKVRAVLLDAISEISKLVEGSPSEQIVYLGIDWIEI